MTLERILGQYGLQIKNKEGELRNAVDVLEDMYLKLTPRDFHMITFEISEEERYANLFDDSRGRLYKEIK